MKAAALRFPLSVRHDLIIPGLVIIGLWIVAAWYYGMNTYPGGVVSNPDMAIAAAKHAPCIAVNSYALQSNAWQANLRGDVWYAHTDFREHFWQNSDGFASVSLDARSGRVIDCRSGATD
jgi:hypothetical protein